MTTEEVLAEVERRGLKLVVKDGKPVLRGDPGQATPALLAVLGHHRDAIRERLSPAPTPPREWLWRQGCRYTEEPADSWLWGHPERNPVGACWWRHAWPPGGRLWRLVDGITGVSELGDRLLWGEGLPPGEYLERPVSRPRRPDAVPAPVAGADGQPAGAVLRGLFGDDDPAHEGAHDG